MRVSKEERAESIATLRQSLEPGDTVHTVLRHVSRSGMERCIDVYKFSVADTKRGYHAPNGVSRDWLSYHVARALGWSFSEKHESVRVGGCGMDMGFHLVYELAATLWPDGFECVGDKCPSNDHSNGGARRVGKKHTKGGGGYALRHEWL